MARLIDADEFISNLKYYIDKPMTAGLCATLVELAPTAYDLNNVVEELEDKAIFYNSASDVDQVIRNAYLDAIEIVKAGGVNERQIFSNIKSDFKYMFLVSCISADNNFTIEDRQENVSRLKICKEAMEEYDEDDKADIEDMINRGIELLEIEISEMRR